MIREPHRPPSALAHLAGWGNSAGVFYVRYRTEICLSIKRALMWACAHGLPFGATECVARVLRRFRWFREG
jgi:hypothetical protein